MKAFGYGIERKEKGVLCTGAMKMMVGRKTRRAPLGNEKLNMIAFLGDLSGIRGPSKSLLTNSGSRHMATRIASTHAYNASALLNTAMEASERHCPTFRLPNRRALPF
jgi:hypothetical protein